MQVRNDRISIFFVDFASNASASLIQTALNLADTKQALVERNELLKSWLQTAQTWVRIDFQKNAVSQSSRFTYHTNR